MSDLYIKQEFKISSSITCIFKSIKLQDKQAVVFILPWDIWKHCEDTKSHSIAETLRIPGKHKTL